MFQVVFVSTVGVEVYLLQYVGDSICISMPTRMYKETLPLIFGMIRNLVFILYLAQF